jgi:hypothetical protein
MLRLEQITASRWYSWVYEAPLDMNKNKRWLSPDASVSEPNPLLGRISVRKVKRGQAATAEMLMRKNRIINPNWQPDPTHVSRWTNTDNPCVVQSNSNGKLLVRIMEPITDKVDYYVDGRPATEEEVLLAKSYITPSKPKAATAARVEFPYVDNLTNVEQ